MIFIFFVYKITTGNAFSQRCTECRAV